MQYFCERRRLDVFHLGVHLWHCSSERGSAHDECDAISFDFHVAKYDMSIILPYAVIRSFLRSFPWSSTSSIADALVCTFPAQRDTAASEVK